MEAPEARWTSRSRPTAEICQNHRNLSANRCCSTIKQSDQHQAETVPAPAAWFSSPGRRVYRWHAHLRACSRVGVAVVGRGQPTPITMRRFKQARLARLQAQAGFRFERSTLPTPARSSVCSRPRPGASSANLAAGGRAASAGDPHAYVDAKPQRLSEHARGPLQARGGASGVREQFQCLRRHQFTLPFSEHQAVDHPISLYAATKGNEPMAHSYSHLFGLCRPRVAAFHRLRLPWGGPTWPCSSLPARCLRTNRSTCSTTAACCGIPHHIDDIVEGIVMSRTSPPPPDPALTPPTPTWPRRARTYRVSNPVTTPPCR